MNTNVEQTTLFGCVRYVKESIEILDRLLNGCFKTLKAFLKEKAKLPKECLQMKECS